MSETMTETDSPAKLERLRCQRIILEYGFGIEGAERMELRPLMLKLHDLMGEK